MRVLFTGKGGSGSFHMRGTQLAAQRPDWKAVPQAGASDFKGVDVAVVVKKFLPENLAALHSWGGPIVFDPLSFWRDEKEARTAITQNARDVDEGRAIFGPIVSALRPNLTLCTSNKMTEDLAPFGKMETFYHHFDPRLVPPPPPQKTGRRRIVYLGTLRYLREWTATIKTVAAELNADFLASEADLRVPTANAMIAVRGIEYDTWLARRWKSNVKAATARRLGMPLVAWPEDSYLETHPEAFWFRGANELYSAMKAAFEAPRPEPEEYRYSAAWAADELTRILKKHF